MPLESSLDLELHVGHINTILTLVQKGKTLISEQPKGVFHLVPLDDSEEFEYLGQIKSYEHTPREVIEHPHLSVSQYRVIGYASGLLGMAAYSRWFYADPALDNPGYNRIWGYLKGKSCGLTAYRVCDITREKKLVSAYINLFGEWDSQPVGTWHKSAVPFKLEVRKDEIDEIYSKIQKMHKSCQRASFKKLYKYFLKHAEGNKLLNNIAAPEQCLKEWGLTLLP